MKRMRELFNVLICHPAVFAHSCSNSNYVCQTCRQILSICSFVCWCYNFWHEIENMIFKYCIKLFRLFASKDQTNFERNSNILYKAIEFVVVQWTLKVYMVSMCYCVDMVCFNKIMCSFTEYTLYWCTHLFRNDQSKASVLAFVIVAF